MPATGDNLRIDPARLWDSLEEMAKIGPGLAGGCNRQTLTDADNEGRHLFQRWCEAAGMTMGVDSMGNMFLTRPGEDPEALPVYMGSHLDTQPTGGKYDGVLGVLGALEVVRTLNDMGVRTRRPIVVTNWTNEEGARFAPAMLCSGVYAGVFTPDYAYSREDRQGVKLGDELERIGYKGTHKAGDIKFQAMFELHIEQGPVLEDHDKTIGVVTGVLGIRWYDCVVTGMEAHAGPTPMHLRKDALQVATRIMQEVVAIANRYPPYGRGTVGMVQVFPNSRNVIPGQVKFSIDLRNVNDELLNKMHEEILAFVDKTSAETGLPVKIERVSYYPPCPFHPDCVGAVRKATEKLGYSTMDVVSGAGHDAIYAARVAPAGMIFVPCKDGISHNEIEDAQPAHLEAGCNVLLHAMLDRAGVV